MMENPKPDESQQHGTESTEPSKSEKHSALMQRLRKGDILATDGSCSSSGDNIHNKMYVLSLAPPPTTEEVSTTPTGGQLAAKVGSNTDVVRIQVMSSVGDGGFGSVYKCIKREKGKSDEDICLKISLHFDFRPTADTEVNKHIIREVENFRHIQQDSHDNIIKFFFVCYCAKSDRVFIGLEYFSGYDLSKMVRWYQDNRKRFPADDITQIMTGVVNAIVHLQRHGIVHCDIKPHNVMFNCAKKLVKVIDFGCAVHFEDGKSFGGTSEYMAPEMMFEPETHADDSDTKIHIDSTDVYGVGALMYHLLTLERPWSHHQEVRDALEKKKRRKVRTAICNAMRDTTTYCGDDGALCQHTDLQSRLRNIHKDHYQIYPDHCDLVHGMLEINHKRRFRCDQILEIITEKCTCPDRRKHRRLQVRQQSQDELQQSQDEQLMEAIFTNMPVSSTPSNFVEEAIIPVFVDQMHTGASSNPATSIPKDLLDKHQKSYLARLSQQDLSASKSTTSHDDTNVSPAYTNFQNQQDQAQSGRPVVSTNLVHEDSPQTPNNHLIRDVRPKIFIAQDESHSLRIITKPEEGVAEEEEEEEEESQFSRPIIQQPQPSPALNIAVANDNKDKDFYAQPESGASIEFENHSTRVHAQCLISTLVDEQTYFQSSSFSVAAPESPSTPTTPQYTPHLSLFPQVSTPRSGPVPSVTTPTQWQPHGMQSSSPLGGGDCDLNSNPFEHYGEPSFMQPLSINIESHQQQYSPEEAGYPDTLSQNMSTINIHTLPHEEYGFEWGTDAYSLRFIPEGSMSMNESYVSPTPPHRHRNPTLAHISANRSQSNSPHRQDVRSRHNSKDKHQRNSSADQQRRHASGDQPTP